MEQELFTIDNRAGHVLTWEYDSLYSLTPPYTEY